MGERRVVQRARLLGDPLGLAAHLDDERLGGQPQLARAAVTPNAQPASRCRSTGGAGEGHRRVQRQRQRADAGGRVQHRGPVAARRCAPRIWPGRTAPVAARPSTSPGSASSGTVSSTRSARASTSAGGDERHAGQQRGRRGAGRRRRRPETATRRWPARCRAAASAGPTRPAPTTPTVRRAGRSSPPPGWARMMCVHARTAFRSSPQWVPDDFSSCYAIVSRGRPVVHRLWRFRGTVRTEIGVPVSGGAREIRA